MSKGDAKFVVAEGRTPEARQIVSRQSELIAKLKASGQPSLDAERALLTYMSALKHLEAHEAVVRADVNARKHEIKKLARRHSIPWPPHQLHNSLADSLNIDRFSNRFGHIQAQRSPELDCLAAYIPIGDADDQNWRSALDTRKEAQDLGAVVWSKVQVEGYTVEWARFQQPPGVGIGICRRRGKSDLLGNSRDQPAVDGSVFDDQ
jgi:hypothetical protein